MSEIKNASNLKVFNKPKAIYIVIYSGQQF